MTPAEVRRIQEALKLIESSEDYATYLFGIGEIEDVVNRYAKETV